MYCRFLQYCEEWREYGTGVHHHDSAHCIDQVEREILLLADQQTDGQYADSRWILTLALLLFFLPSNIFWSFSVVKSLVHTTLFGLKNTAENYIALLANRGRHKSFGTKTEPWAIILEHVLFQGLIKQWYCKISWVYILHGGCIICMPSDLVTVCINMTVK